LGSFLYDDLSSPDLSRAPFGPILRAGKLKQAGVIIGDGRNGVARHTAWEREPQHTCSTAIISPHPTGLGHDKSGATERSGKSCGHPGRPKSVCQPSTDDQERSASQWKGVIDRTAFSRQTERTAEGRASAPGPADLTAQQQAEVQAALNAYAKNKITAAEQVNELFGREIFP